MLKEVGSVLVIFYIELNEEVKYFFRVLLENMREYRWIVE